MGFRCILLMGTVNESYANYAELETESRGFSGCLPRIVLFF